MEPSRQLITPAEAADLFGTSVGYIYKLASLNGWVRVRHSGKIHYDLLQVAERLSK